MCLSPVYTGKQSAPWPLCWPRLVAVPSPTFGLVFLAKLQLAGKYLYITSQVKLKAGVMIGLTFDFLDKTELGSSEVVELLAALLMANKLLLHMARVELLLVLPQLSFPFFTFCLLKPYLMLVQTGLSRDPAMCLHSMPAGPLAGKDSPIKLVILNILYGSHRMQASALCIYQYTVLA